MLSERVYTQLARYNPITQGTEPEVPSHSYEESIVTKYLLASLALLSQHLHAEAAYVWENALTLESIHNFSGGIKRLR